MEIEQEILNNLKKYYTDANNKRIHLDNIHKEIVNINPKQNNSICLWNGLNSIVYINNKCNHLLLYNCNDITIRTFNFISGITCIKCNNCNILFNTEMLTNIEMSKSFNINIRSYLFNSTILYNGIDINIIKHINCNILDYIKINDGLLSTWRVKNLNF